MYAVDRAAEVAQAAQAKLIVVTAYREGAAATAEPAPGTHREIFGVPAGAGRPSTSR